MEDFFQIFTNVETDLIILVYIVWNIANFFMMGLDKHKARKKEWRISEHTLILSAFCMGALGSIAGIYTFRHKTKKLSVKVPILIAVVCNLVIIYMYISKLLMVA